VDRRLFLSAVVPAAGAALLLPQRGAAADKKDATALTVSELTDKLFVICGGGGNVTVFNSTEGVLLVDGGSPERSSEVLKLVKKRTGAAKIHTLFNTHWHWDQTGSNETLGKAGTRIIAHENTRLWLTTDVDSKWQKRVFMVASIEFSASRSARASGTPRPPTMRVLSLLRPSSV
jgi:glyoxylase-like metal-dependent hydrolase (beta-lactamase superfamily II)